MKTKILILSLVAMLCAGCSLEQMRRDSLRFKATDRGVEKYKLNDKDSLNAALERNDQEINAYIQHLAAYIGIVKKAKTPGDIDDVLGSLHEWRRNESQLAASSPVATQTIGGLAPASAPSGLMMGSVNADNELVAAPTHAATSNEKEKQPAKLLKQKAGIIEPSLMMERITVPDGDKANATESSLPGKSALETYWPASVLNKIQSTTQVEETGKTTTTTQPDESLIRALSSTMAIDQMRDLLTEPTFPSLLPTEREVHLGCLPPPESAAFEAVQKLSALMQQQAGGQQQASNKIGVDTEFSSRVVKLFEESERTVFLQYALFRLCEMSINAPSGFRNVYPVVVHDIVRQTAEMNQVANKEAEVTRQKELDLKIIKAQSDESAEAVLRAQKLTYLKCVGTKVEKDMAAKKEDIIAECKALINGSP